jgi:GNAT superfamily N-acetyltransferase
MKQITTVCEATRDQWPAIVDLIMQQERRLLKRDARLRDARPANAIQDMLREHSADGEKPLVVLDAKGHVRGYAKPDVWSLASSSILLAFLTEHNGITRSLTLPNPDDEDAQEVAQTLLEGLSNVWQTRGTTGDLIRWPSSDAWFEPSLLLDGFLLDSICAQGPLRPLEPVSRRAPQAMQIRLASQQDEDTLLDLFTEELRFHEAYTPFARVTPALQQAFRRKLAQSWRGVTFSEGAPLVLVAEHEGQIVGMAENTLIQVEQDDEPNFTRPGNYLCLDNVCLYSQWRTRGVGRLLTQSVINYFANQPYAGVLLWYSIDNPLSSQFWPHLGFDPLWTTYQRINA